MDKEPSSEQTTSDTAFRYSSWLELLSFLNPTTATEQREQKRSTKSVEVNKPGVQTPAVNLGYYIRCMHVVRGRYRPSCTYIALGTEDLIQYLTLPFSGQSCFNELPTGDSTIENDGFSAEASGVPLDISDNADNTDSWSCDFTVGIRCSSAKLPFVETQPSYKQRFEGRTLSSDKSILLPSLCELQDGTQLQLTFHSPKKNWSFLRSNLECSIFGGTATLESQWNQTQQGETFWPMSPVSAFKVPINWRRNTGLCMLPATVLSQTPNGVVTVLTYGTGTIAGAGGYAILRITGSSDQLYQRAL
jgi:hypothetical protein